MTTPIEELFPHVPELGIVVRDEGDGFHARFTPMPPISYSRTAAVLGAWGVVCAVVAWFTSDITELRGLIFAGGMTLGALMYAFHVGQQFIPVEIAASGGTLYFHGDRRPLSTVRGATLRGIDLEVHDLDGTVVASVHGVPGPVGDWLVRAIDVMAEGAR